MSFGEQVLDLLTRTDVPIRHAGSHHLLLCPLRQTFAFTDSLHNFERPFLRQTAGDQIDHYIVTTADGLIHPGSAGHNEIFRVTQPHIRSVGIAGNTHQKIEFFRLGVQQNPTGEAGIKLRHSHRAGGPQDLIILIA